MGCGRRVPLSGENSASHVRGNAFGGEQLLAALHSPLVMLPRRGAARTISTSVVRIRHQPRERYQPTARAANGTRQSFLISFEPGSSDFNRPSDAITRASSAWRLVPVLA